MDFNQGFLCKLQYELDLVNHTCLDLDAFLRLDQKNEDSFKLPIISQFRLGYAHWRSHIKPFIGKSDVNLDLRSTLYRLIK